MPHIPVQGAMELSSRHAKKLSTSRVKLLISDIIPEDQRQDTLPAERFSFRVEFLQFNPD